MKKRNILIIILICVVLAGLGVGGFFLIQNQNNQKIYREKLAEGQKYLSQMKYEEAEAAFEFALDKNPKDEDAYVGLYRVYSAQGQYHQAVYILEKGYNLTKSERLVNLLDSLEAKNAELVLDDQGNVSKENLDAISQDVMMNVALFQKFRNYTFAQYEKDYGDCTSHEMNGEKLEIVHQKLEGVFTYENKRGEDKVIDASKELPYENAAPVSVRLQNLSTLFRSFDAGLCYERLCSIVGSVVECAYNEEQGTYTDSFEYQNCQVEIACDEEGDILSGTAWNQILLPEISASTGGVEGRIVNAVTGEGVEGATVRFTSASTGEEITVETDRYGSYEAEIAPGEYTMIVEKEGFIQEETEIQVEEEGTTVEDDIPISPELGEGEIRIVLTWGAVPHDLDSYLTNLDTRDQISYANKEMTEDGETIAELDVDEMDGYGPETVTIYRPGNYQYRVHDFRHEGLMGGSEAMVKIYMPDQDPVEIQIPAGEGDLWNVCEFEDGELKIINELEPNHSDRSSYK